VPSEIRSFDGPGMSKGAVLTHIFLIVDSGATQILKTSVCPFPFQNNAYRFEENDDIEPEVPVSHIP